MYIFCLSLSNPALMKNIGIREIFLLQVILYLLAWAASRYLAQLLAVLFASITLLLTLIALVAEGLEPSRIPRFYFQFMLASFVAPLLVLVVMWALGPA